MRVYNVGCEGKQSALSSACLVEYTRQLKLRTLLRKMMTMMTEMAAMCCWSEEEDIPPIFDAEEASSEDISAELTSDSDSEDVSCDSTTYKAKDGSIRKSQPPRRAAYRSSNIVRTMPGPPSYDAKSQGT